MAKPNREMLNREFVHYTNLLKEHESKFSETKPHLSRGFRSKQPVLPAHKVVANSTQSLAVNGSYSLNKLHSLNSSTHYQSNRTVLFHENKNFNSKYVPVVQSHTTRSVKPPVKNINKRVMNENHSNKYKMASPNYKDSCKKQLSVLSNVPKNVSLSKYHLMKELTDVIEQLKTRQSKIQVSNIKDKTSKQTANQSCKSFKALNNCNTVSKDNVFSKNNVKSVSKILPCSITSNPNSLLSHSKLSCISKTSDNSSHSLLLGFNKKPEKSFHFSKSGNNEMQTIKLKVCNFPSVGIATKDLTANAQQKSTSLSQLSGQAKNPHSKVSVPNTTILQPKKTSSVQPKTTMLRCQVNDKKLVIAKEPSKYKVTRKKLVNLSKLASPVVSSAKTKSVNIYSKVNNKNSIKLNKNQLKTSNIYPKTPLNLKGIKRKVNLKYKVVNSTNPSLKIVNLKTNQRSELSSPLIFDKSDPLYELLHESSAIDKLEQELLAKSLPVSITPKSTSKGIQVNKTPGTLNRISPKFCIKKTPLKRSKLLSSKYKVINKTLKTPQNYSVKRKSCTPLKSSTKKLCNKVVYSKFTIINKQCNPANTSPVIKGKSILVKRLYKSKKAIINKNSSPSNLSAKIKSKYFALNKRRLPKWQKHLPYVKVPMRQQKFKGSFRTNRLCRKNLRFQKTLVNRSTRPRKFSCYHINNQQFNKRTNIWLKKKSVSGGEILISKSPKRIVIGGKTYIKTGNTLKAVLPSSTNLASRALHRSINRVLSASTKKSLMKVNTYCMFYNRFGRCNRGVKCTYIHDPSKIAVCTRFLRGTCKIDGCPFSHEVSPGKMAICTFFLLGSCEKENCPYRHEKLSPDAELCKAFVQGYCPEGKECKKAHILICPKFIQGGCEKGNSCVYPHPPQKAKKNVQKETTDEKDEEKKFDDIWLEKVARYFQACEDSSINCKKASHEKGLNQVLPKRARIEEQPSFIPLCGTPVSSCPQNEQ